MWGGWWSTDWPSDSSDSEEVAAVSEVEVTVFAVERLSEFARRVFGQFGVGESEATEAAEILAQADLRGIDSHGIARLHA